MAGLFSNESDALVAQQAADNAGSMSQAEWGPAQWANYGMAQGGKVAGRGVRGLLGIEDPALKELAVGRAMMKGVDMNDPDALEKLAKAYAEQGMHRFGEDAFNKAQEIKKARFTNNKLKAETDLAEARAKATGQSKQSSADIAARRDVISKVEERLTNGETISDNDPDLIKARAALAIETKSQYIKQEDGSILSVPGIAASEYAPLLGKRLGGTTPIAVDQSVPGSGLDMSKVTPDQLKAMMQDDPTGQALAKGIARFNTKQSSNPSVIQTPTSIKKAEQEQTALKTRAGDLQFALDAVDRAEKLISPWSTGWGAKLGSLPNTEAKSLANTVKTLQSASVLGTLSQLKEASKTGASGLGQVTEKELPLLEARIISLDPESKTFPEDLAYIKRVWTKIQTELNNKVQGKPSPSVNRDAKINQYMQAYPGYSRSQVEAFLKQNKVID